MEPRVAPLADYNRSLQHRLIADEILIGWPEVWNRIEVVEACRIEKPGEVGGMLGRVHRDLDYTIRDNRNCPFRVPTRPPQRSPNRMPRPMKLVELYPLAFEVLSERVHRDGLVPSGARLLGASSSGNGRLGRLAWCGHEASRESANEATCLLEPRTWSRARR